MRDDDLDSKPVKATNSPRPIWLALLAVIMVAVPYLTWHETWFGRQLSDEKVAEYLNSSEKPRRIQHALTQIADRIVDGDRSVERWYPRILALAGHPEAAIRTTAAWVMGQDNRSDEFHRALRELLEDPELIVRRNAALSLVRFGDASGRAELAGILEPLEIISPAAGVASTSLELGQAVGSETLLVRVVAADGKPIEVRAPFTGTVDRIHVREGSQVKTGDPLVRLTPASDQVWEALRGLYLVGEPDDLQLVESYELQTSDMPHRVRQQASLTAQAIRTRSEPSPSR